MDLKELDNEAAFRTSTAENVDRATMSAYETGLSLVIPLKKYYGGVQARLSEALGKNEIWVSRHLKMAKLPRELPDAYGDWTAISFNHCNVLTSELNRDRAALKKRAAALFRIQKDRVAEDKEWLTATQCLNYRKRLLISSLDALR